MDSENAKKHKLMLTQNYVKHQSRSEPVVKVSRLVTKTN